MLLKADTPRIIGGNSPRLVFGEEAKATGAWAGRRLLLLDDKPAFELSFWCGTCQFVFQRLEGANAKLSLDELQQRLALGLDDLDAAVISGFAPLLAKGNYLPLLLTVEPRLICPGKPGDYFAEEEISTWGIDSFWGLPEYPKTPYYRTFETGVTGDAHLFEFVVPMVPPAWNDATKIAEYASTLQTSSAPTAVAVSTLDVCAPAMDNQSTDYYEHWGLTHFLLDGHHKMQAAAEAGRPLRLLSLLAVDASLATPEQVAQVPLLRSQPASCRVAR
jgi:hypothetical protein